MIDTIKIFTKISESTYIKIKSSSIVKRSFNMGTGEIYYDVINDHLKGSFDSSLSIRPDFGDKYGFYGEYILNVEGSLHKLLKGQNAYDGFYNLQEVVSILIKVVENSYDIVLPEYDKWYLKRVDIAKCFDFYSQENVKNYINNLKLLDYPRRKIQHYRDCGVYFTGTTTTLKIYNKLLEFNKNDRNKLKNNQFFNIFEFSKKIKGFCRFEVEIKNKKLLKMYEDIYGAKIKNVPCKDINYEMLDSIWVDDFMKVIKVNFTNFKKISDKDSVEKRLLNIYGIALGRSLYEFYLSLVVDGCNKVRNNSSKSTYYRKIKQLKDVGIDFSSNNISIIYDNIDEVIDIFNMCEVV